MSDASSSLAKLAASLFTAVAGKTYSIKDGTLTELASASIVALGESGAESTAEFDFLTLTVPYDVAAGATFEAQFFGTQGQAAITQTLVFYAKVNGGASVTIGSVGTGAAAQSFRAISGRALFSFPTVGAAGAYFLGGDFSVNGIAAQSSNSASTRAADTRAGMTLTLGMRCSISNAANINRVISGYIKQVA